MRAVALLLLLAGCGKVENSTDAAIDAPPHDAPGDADLPIDAYADAGLGGWGTPVRVAELNTAMGDQDPTLTADGLEIIFSSNRTGSAMTDLWTAKRTAIGSTFSTPVLVAGVNSNTDDEQPWLSPDGLLMYFASERSGNFDIYVTARATRTSAWSAPSPVTELNSASNDYMGGLTPDGLTISIATDRSGAATLRDIYVATRPTAAQPFGVPSVVASLATASIETAPVYAGNGARMYFVRSGDLWVVDCAGGNFGTAHRIDELSDFTEGDPHVFEDERTMWFSRNDSTGTGIDLFVSTR